MDILKLVTQNKYTDQEFLAEANKINADPLSRVPQSEKAFLDPVTNQPNSVNSAGKGKVFIDAHAHSFNINHIPRNFSAIIKKIPARKLQLTIKNWAKLLDQKFLDYLGRESQDIVQKLYNNYSAFFPSKRIYLVNLMMDMERAIGGMPIRSFEDQLKELIILRTKSVPNKINYTTTLLPFFAFDPHNPNAYTQFLSVFKANDHNLFGDQGNNIMSVSLPFVGLKLYPPLGYSPKDATLFHVFKVCQDKNIPVLSHQGGIRTHTEYKKVELKEWTNTDNGTIFKTRTSPDIFIKSGVGQLDNIRQISNVPSLFMDPQKWEDVLLHFPRLKVCLAHMGDNLHWIEFREILQLFKDHGIRFSSQTFTKLHEQVNASQNGFSATIKRELEASLTKLATNYIFNTLRIITKYDEAYTDVSYAFVIKKNMEVIAELVFDPVWQKKILFGSDFFMTAVEKEGNFNRRPTMILKKMIDKKDKSIWEKLSYFNTIKYLFGTT